MKEKILKAIDKGLMNVLSPDIKDQDIDFNHDNINSEYIPYDIRTIDMGKVGIWCEYNLGAYPGNKPEDWYGDYYAWGETETKDNYSGGTHEHCEGPKETLTKYNKIDTLKYLEPNDDVITQTLGEKFRMPTYEEYQRLVKNTTNEWVKNYKGIYGLNGRLFIAENGNTLFFPATGRYTDSQHYGAGKFGGVWSASLHYGLPLNAFQLCFNSAGVSVDNDCRYDGLPVRGIQKSL